MGTRSGSGGILGWEKSGGGGGGGDYDEELQEQEEECDVGLGLRMQLNENNSDSASSSSSSVFPNRKAAPGLSFHGTSVAAHYHHHPYHHYLTGDYVGGSVHGNTSNLRQISYMGLGGGGGSPGNSLHVLDCFASGGSSTTKASKSLQHHPLSISGKMRESGNVRVPFTAAQWQELERQNMILKYMMASIPVPPELLLPISTTKSFSNVVPPSRSGGDLEPWRCRRTDGKKWRCSRDVAPHQKYCERHSHKNRPRSRKPVELPATAAASTDYFLNPAAKSTAAAKRSLASQPQHQHQPSVDSRQAPSSHFITTFDQDTPSGFPSSVASSQPFDQPRCLDWFVKGETIPNQDWHPHQHQCNDMSMGLKVDTTGYRRNNSGSGSSNMDPFQLKQASQYSVMPQQCSLLLMEGAVEPGHGQQTRRFIDAWSDVDEGGGNRAISSYNPSSGKNFDLPTSSLTLTMCGGEGDEYSLGSHRMGEKPHWMSGGMGHHGLWMGSPPGGPLAEALCLGSNSGGGSGGGAGCNRYQTSPRGCSSVTTTSTSSPSSSKDEGQEELNFIAYRNEMVEGWNEIQAKRFLNSSFVVLKTLLVVMFDCSFLFSFPLIVLDHVE